MRGLTAEAATIAAGLGRANPLRDHGGGFSPATIQLHRISAELSTGDPSTALAAARALHPRTLPTVERRARYYTDVAAALPGAKGATNASTSPMSTAARPSGTNGARRTWRGSRRPMVLAGIR